MARRSKTQSVKDVVSENDTEEVIETPAEEIIEAVEEVKSSETKKTNKKAQSLQDFLF